jgi:hypothetical protein
MQYPVRRRRRNGYGYGYGLSNGYFGKREYERENLFDSF